MVQVCNILELHVHVLGHKWLNMSHGPSLQYLDGPSCNILECNVTILVHYMYFQRIVQIYNIYIEQAEQPTLLLFLI